MHGNTVQDHLDMILEHAQSLNLITEADVERTFGFNEKDINAVADDPKWVNLFTHLETSLKANFTTGDFGKTLAAKRVYDSLGYQANFCSDSAWPGISARVPSGIFRDAMDSLRAVIAVKGDKASTIITMCSLLRMSELSNSGDAVHKAVSAKWNAVYKKYPLLSMISWNTSGNARDAIIDYVNAVDATTVVAAPKLKVA
jgi:hypothetical protein